MLLLLLLPLFPLARASANPNPKPFTDDPYVDDAKFTEKGCIFVAFTFCYFNQKKKKENIESVVEIAVFAYNVN